MNKFFNKRLEEFETRESGWMLKSIDYLDIRLTHYSPMIGGCLSVKLPKGMSKSVISLKSDDQECFKHALSLLTKDKLVWNKINFPSTTRDLAQFETNNPKFQIYCYGFDREFFIFYKSESQKQKQILPLLWFKNHFFPIIDEPRFLKYLYKSKTDIFVCRSCLTSFSSSKLLTDHYPYCQLESPTKVRLPPPNFYLEFTRHRATTFFPFVCYLDTESNLEPLEKTISNTVSFQKHIPSAFGLLFIDKTKNFHSYKQFQTAEDLIAELEKIAIHLFKFSKEMDKQEREKANQAMKTCKICSYCNKSFTKQDPPVRDHDHFTGKFRSIIHQSCNLQLRTVNFLPVFSHNMMRYDEKSLIRAIKNKSTIIGKNIEKLSVLSLKLK